MAERVRRAVKAMVPNPRTKAGMIQALGLSQERGTTLTQWRKTPKMMIRNIPMTKLGTDTPMLAIRALR